MTAPPPRRPVVQGHRGFRAEWPENTLPGFLAALRAGADAIELDVALTRDGVVVVCHDPSLNPDLTRAPDGMWIAAPGPVVGQTTFDELRAYDVGRARPGGRTACAFPRQRAVDGTVLPTLAEVFALAAPFAAAVDVELKTNPAMPDPDSRTLAEAVVAVALDTGAQPRLALRSFDWRGLEHARHHWPDIALTWLTEAGRPPGWRGRRPGPVPDSLVGLAGATWAPDHRDLTRDQVERARAMGLRVVPWTVNDAADMARLIDWGVDGLCTDDVAMALALIAAMA